MTLITVEGIYENGRINLTDMPPNVKRARVLVTFLPAEGTLPSPSFMTYGQCSGERMSTEEDFEIAEWRGEPDQADGD